MKSSFHHVMFSQVALMIYHQKTLTSQKVLLGVQTVADFHASALWRGGCSYVDQYDRDSATVSTVGVSSWMKRQLLHIEAILIRGTPQNTDDS